MRIFVTGHRGYIGSLLVPLLKNHGYYVTGCDLNLFAGSEFEGGVLQSLTLPDNELLQDIRSISPEQLKGHDCIMHLAAISNDPMGEINPTLTESINRDASIHLALSAKAAGVPRFLFASSCSIYGQSGDCDLDENAPLAPLSVYARSKIEAEREISKMADGHFSPAFLRNSTAYGVSPMLRLDLMVNNLMAHAFTTGNLLITSDGSPWRPLIHAKDIARVFDAFLHATRSQIHNRAVNIGANSENYQVRQVAEKIIKLFPQAKLIFTGELGADPRNYRVNFDLFNRLMPDFQLEYTLDRALQELYHAFADYQLTAPDFESGKFIRLSRLRTNIKLLGAVEQ